MFFLILVMFVVRLHDYFLCRGCMIFLRRGCMIFCVERLNDFLCGEVACFLSSTHSLRLKYPYSIFVVIGFILIFTMVLLDWVLLLHNICTTKHCILIDAFLVKELVKLSAETHIQTLQIVDLISLGPIQSESFQFWGLTVWERECFENSFHKWWIT